jgi:hypothetical protein
MNEKTETNQRRRSAAGPTAGNSDPHEHDHEPAGIDLPVLCHVPYKSVGFPAGPGVAGAAGVIEWPAAAAGYALRR